MCGVATVASTAIMVSSWDRHVASWLFPNPEPKTRMPPTEEPRVELSDRWHWDALIIAPII